MAYGLRLRDIFEYSYRKWFGDRIVDLLTVCGMGQVDQASAKRYADGVREAENAILALMDPFKKYRDGARIQERKDDADKQRFIDALSENSPGGFGSLAEIKQSIGELAKNLKRVANNEQ